MRRRISLRGCCCGPRLRRTCRTRRTNNLAPQQAHAPPETRASTTCPPRARLCGVTADKDRGKPKRMCSSQLPAPTHLRPTSSHSPARSTPARRALHGDPCRSRTHPRESTLASCVTYWYATTCGEWSCSAYCTPRLANARRREGSVRSCSSCSMSSSMVLAVLSYLGASPGRQPTALSRGWAGRRVQDHTTGALPLH
jgi:hypothetical protein